MADYHAAIRKADEAEEKYTEMLTGLVKDPNERDMIMDASALPDARWRRRRACA